MRKIITCLILTVIAMFASLWGHADDTGKVWRLPSLTNADAWQMQYKGDKKFGFSSSNDALFVSFNCAKDNAAELRLKEPVPMPDEATGFTFMCGNNSIPSGLCINVIFKDAAGNEFYFYTLSWFSFKKGVFFPEHSQRRGCEERFIVPGLKRPLAEPNSNATLRGLKPSAKPVRPYSLVGLEFVGDHQYKGSEFTDFFFRGFCFTNLNSENSSLYYQFRDQEHFGELDPLPSLTPAHMSRWYGKRFEMSWDVRDAYEGNPFIADGRTFEMSAENSSNKDGIPFALQMAQKIEFPVTEKGTYWVRVKNRWTNNVNNPVPELVEEKEYRLDILNGKKNITRTPVSAEMAIPNCYVRIAPERKSLIYSGKEKFAVRVVFQNPGEKVKDLSCGIAVSTASGGEEVRKFDLVPVWDSNNRFSAEADLSGLPVGAYKLKATIFSGKKVFDESERLLGKQGVQEAAANVAIPSSVASWKDLLNRPKPMFHLTPMLPSEVSQDSKKAWDEYYRPFLDRAGEMSSEIELSFDWNTVEPLPGIFDWGFVDRFVDYAQTKGLTVQLWPSFRDLPEWMPGFYEKSSEGQVFGSKQAYLFHGGRPNYVNAPAMRDGIKNLVKNVAMRYRVHPAVQSYFFCFEHPGDAPYMGWYEGYADESIQAFRKDCQKNWKDIGIVNKRWGTKFASWNEIVPPVKESVPQYWLDWLLFKKNGINGLLRECVTSLRSVDQKRLIDMYADGITDFKWYHDQGCMSANGGSHDTMAMADYAAFPMLGLPQRTEDHSPGNWTAYFPTQLDASVFAMMAGGGANAHCKAYVFTKNRFEDAKDPNVSLGRYKRFMPIWTELRQTELAQPVEVFQLKDLAAYLVEGKTTYTGWWSDPWVLISLSQAQVPCGSGYDNLWEKGKLLFLASTRFEQMGGDLIDQVVRYAENGGTVLMSASVGRKRIEDQKEDWVLLKKFGFAPPEGEMIKDRPTIAVPTGNTVFNADSKPFTLRDLWSVKPPEDAETVAYFDNNPQRAAITWKNFGKGKVAVVWAQTVVPPLFALGNGKYAFMSDVAKWAGVQPSAEVTDNRLWTNLLKTKDDKKFYGLVHVGSWQKSPSSQIEGSVRWLKLPEGAYQITELISGKELGEWSADKLKKEGISLKLGPKEVAIYRMIMI